MAGNRKTSNDNDFLAYKLDQLTVQVSSGFNRVESKLESQDVRINGLYEWRAGIEKSASTSLSSKDLGKIILAVVGALTVALGIVSQVLK